MRRHALAATGALCGAILVVVLLGTGLGWWRGTPTGGAAPSEKLTVATSLTPNPAYFGDPVEARVTVGYDATLVSPSSVHVSTQFGPYVEAAAPTITHTRFGGTGSVVYLYHLQCLTDGCLPAAKPLALSFGRAVVSVRSADEALRESARWPVLVVTSRLTPAATSASAHFRSGSTLPGATYRIPPELLTIALAFGAVVLAIAAFALLGIEVARLRERRRRAATISRRAIAIAYVREAADRDEGDRRKALGLLAETLAAEGDGTLASAADDAAWSEHPPTVARALGLADEVQAAGPVEPS
jgi:hypothetical protein